MLKTRAKRSSRSPLRFIKLKSRNYIRSKSSTSIIIMYNLITVILIAVFYPIIPILLNYPPNNEEVSKAY